jgi:hypothetical protein
MALRLSTDLKNYIVNQGIAKQVAGTMGTGGTASLKIYTGSQPSLADDAASGTLLCTISGIGWGGSNGTIGATSGTSALASTAGYSGTAATSGTAGWARMETVGTGFTGSAGTHRIDGDVGLASPSVFVISGLAMTAGGIVSLLSANLSAG